MRSYRRALFQNSKQRGFTLIEVLVAITIMALGLTGIATMGVSTIKADIQSQGASVATALARERLDQLRILGRNEADWTLGSNHIEAGLDEDGSMGSGPYTRTWVVEELDSVNYPNLCGLRSLFPGTTVPSALPRCTGSQGKRICVLIPN